MPHAKKALNPPPRSVVIMGRKRGDSRNIVTIVCDLYDMSVYVDMLRKMINQDTFDYLIIEPQKFKDLFEAPY